MLEIDSISTFIILVLATFRLTRLIVFDKITAFLRSPFHETIEEENNEGTIELYIVPKGKGIRKWVGELLSCYWCTGIWCSALVLVLYYFLPTIGMTLIYLLAIAGLAGMLERLVSGN